jgi:hypothetical protein
MLCGAELFRQRPNFLVYIAENFSNYLATQALARESGGQGVLLDEKNRGSKICPCHCPFNMSNEHTWWMILLWNEGMNGKTIRPYIKEKNVEILFSI